MRSRFRDSTKDDISKWVGLRIYIYFARGRKCVFTRPLKPILLPGQNSDFCTAPAAWRTILLTAYSLLCAHFTAWQTERVKNVAQQHERQCWCNKTPRWQRSFHFLHSSVLTKETQMYYMLLYAVFATVSYIWKNYLTFNVDDRHCKQGLVSLTTLKRLF
jgi:hypothetical protein